VLGLTLAVAVVAVALVPDLLPKHPQTNEDATRIAAGIIFAASYLGLALGKIPGLSIDRAGVALVGACLMVLSGALPLHDAARAIDFNTMILLLGMMITVANLRLAGAFAVAASWAVRRAGNALVLLCAVTALAGLFSAFLVNDAVCLVLAPLVLDLTLRTGRNPLPYLLAVAMASNVGSVATMTGNPQNIMIGSFSRIPYADFALALGPVALAGLVVTVALVALLHRAEFATAVRVAAAPPRIRINRVLLARPLLASAVMIVLFFIGQPPAEVAIVVSALLLLTRRVKSRRVYAEIDWSLLLMFAGLFIIIAGAERALFASDLAAAAGRLHLNRAPVLSLVTAVLSNLVSNVPAVLMLKPFVGLLARPDTAWLTIAMASTLAGNFTVLGSVANLIVVEKAAARGVRIGFWDYFRVGAPLTLVTLLLGTVWLSL
jgi:Na+/H+ antiporter NhaD/arsenite permease-like protein